MYQFASVQQTDTGKLSTFLLRFQTEECILRVNESKITCETAYNKDDFDIEGYHGQGKDKKALYFCRFVIIALTVRPRNTYMCLFRALSDFCNF